MPVGLPHAGVHLPSARRAQSAWRQARSSMTSRCRFSLARRSVSSARTAPASPPCSRSWPERSSLERRSEAESGLFGRHPDQEPELDESKTVLDNVQEGVAASRRRSTAYNEISSRWPSRMPTSTRCWPRWAPCRNRSTRGCLGPRLPARAGDGRSPNPPPRRRRRNLSGGEKRRVALSKLLLSRSPTCCCSTSRPTTSTPRACSGSSSTSPSTTALFSPSPTIGTSWTMSPSGSPSSTAATRIRMRATTPRTWRRRASASKGEGTRTPSSQAPGRRARMGRSQRQGPPGQVQGAAAALRGDGGRGRQTRKLDFEELHIPPGPRLGAQVIDARTSTRASTAACSSMG